MADAAGIAGLVLAFAITGLLGWRNPRIRLVIWVAFAVRILLTLSHNYGYPLSDSGNARMFELLAWEIASGGLAAFLLHAAQADQYFFSLILAVPYAIFGRAVLLVHLINVLVGVLIVVQAYRLAAELWDETAALRAAWIVALLPSAAIYSAVLLREVFVVYPMLAGMTLLARWHRTERVGSLVGGIVLLVIAGIFHPGVFLALPVVAVSALLRYGAVPARMSFRRLAAVAVFLAVAFGVVYGVTELEIGAYKLTRLFRYGVWQTLMASFTDVPERLLFRDDVLYSTLCVRSPLDILWCGPLRVVEFLSAPFAWRVSRFYDVIRFVEALALLAMLVLAASRLPEILASPRRRFVAAAAFVLTVTFSLGSMELNQSHRHRAKLAPLFIVLAATALPSVRWVKEWREDPGLVHGEGVP